MNEVTFESIIGYADVKEELVRICDALKNRECYAALGVGSPRGLFLHGIPGVGKSLMAAALIRESGRKSFTCRKDEPNGEFVKKIRDTFREAADNAPSIVFLDDVDKFANGDDNHRDAEEYVTIQSCIDDLKGQEVFVLATANNIRKIPDSLLRSGRFDRVMEIEAPTGEDAERIITHYLKGKKQVQGVEGRELARLMEGMSCADLESMINDAGVLACFERAGHIGMEHMIRVALRKQCGIKGWKTGSDVRDPAEEDRRRQIAWHEAGHALVREIYDPGTVALMCIEAGRCRGVTQYAASVRYRYDPAKERMIQVLGSLAGPAATEQRFGGHDFGAIRDIIDSVTEIRGLIENRTLCGFSFADPGARRCPSEALTARAEIAVNAEIERLYCKAKEILAVNRKAHERLAEALYEKGLMTEEDVREVLAGCELREVGW